MRASTAPWVVLLPPYGESDTLAAEAFLSVVSMALWGWTVNYF